MASKGERRVVITHNPSEDPTVAEIKRRAAHLINLTEAIPNGNGECARWKSLAQTAVEEAAMWAVKAATAGQVPDDG